jgi:hypothetical protein
MKFKRALVLQTKRDKLAREPRGEEIKKSEPRIKRIDAPKGLAQVLELLQGRIRGVEYQRRDLNPHALAGNGF